MAIETAIPLSMLGKHISTFLYTNYKGETEVRKVIADRVVWMDDPGFGYEPGWFLLGWCLSARAMRQFRFDPERMRPNDTDEKGREWLSAHGSNILLQVR